MTHQAILAFLRIAILLHLHRALFHHPGPVTNAARWCLLFLGGGN
jgi:hypothetical protein